MFKGLLFFIKSGWKYDKYYILWNIFHQLVRICKNTCVHSLQNVSYRFNTICVVYMAVSIWTYITNCVKLA